MIILDLFPGGVIQLWDSIANGYWHARRLTFLMGGTFHKLEWLRMVATWSSSWPAPSHHARRVTQCVEKGSPAHGVKAAPGSVWRKDGGFRVADVGPVRERWAEYRDRAGLADSDFSLQKEEALHDPRGFSSDWTFTIHSTIRTSICPAGFSGGREKTGVSFHSLYCVT